MRRFNMLAFFFILVAAPIGFLVQFLLKPPQEVLPVFVSAPLLILFDGVYRLRNAQFAGRRKWLTSAAGGYIALVPVWIWGTGLLIYAIVSFYISGFG